MRKRFYFPLAPFFPISLHIIIFILWLFRVLVFHILPYFYLFCSFFVVVDVFFRLLCVARKFNCSYEQFRHSSRARAHEKRLIFFSSLFVCFPPSIWVFICSFSALSLVRLHPQFVIVFSKHSEKRAGWVWRRQTECTPWNGILH